MISRRHLLFAAGAAPLTGQERKRPEPPKPERSSSNYQLKVDPASMPEIPESAPRPAAEAPAPFASAQWKISYFLDEVDRNFTITGFVHPAPEFALAVGVLVDTRRGSTQNTGVVTRDGGTSWNQIRLPRPPVSAFALDAAHVWLVGGGRLYFSKDQGGSWTRLRLPRRMAQVCFNTPLTGFAFGAGKTFHRTSDGGQKWTPVAEGAQLPLTDETTLFRSMSFVNERVGLLAGNSRRISMDEDDYLPAWMTPERALTRRPRPATTVVLSTLDGGATWRSSVTSAFGDIERVSLAGTRGAALFQYGEGFVWPSEVFRSDLSTGKNESLFRRKGLRVTDVSLVGQAGYLLAAIEPFGRLPGAGLPGRLRVICSPDGKQWFQMPVDYRAQAPHALLAGHGESMFAALSNGMILRMER